jgi:uncharacterized membrane protein YedE/YeeE
MRTQVAGGLIGVVFGVVLCWSGMSDPDVIHQALTFQSAYLYLMFAAAVTCSGLGLALVRRRRARAVLTGERIGWTPDRLQRRHLTGAALFGIGWGVTGVCPGPIATQLGQGIAWALPLAAGALAGVWLHQRRQDPETEPAADKAPPAPERELVTA